MSTKAYKVTELTGALLDAAVAMAEGLTLSGKWCYANYCDDHCDGSQGWYERDTESGCEMRPTFNYEGVNYVVQGYSTDPNHGLAIIEREKISVCADGDEWTADTSKFGAFYGYETSCDGPTMLIAAMRAYVLSRFGDKIELPV